LPCARETFHYPVDPPGFFGALRWESFPGVQNEYFGPDEGFGVTHTHFGSASIVASSVPHRSRRGI